MSGATEPVLIREKKRIAFCWTQEINELSGGIERVTSRIMRGLEKRGYDCIYIRHDTLENRIYYQGTSIDDINFFLRENRIDIVVNQNAYSSEFSAILRGSRWEGRYIVCHHSEPRYLHKIFNAAGALKQAVAPRTSLKKRLGWMVRLALYPIWRALASHKISRTQRRNYDAADTYVLLSERFKGEFQDLIKLEVAHKLFAVGNPLSFTIPQQGALELIAGKQNIALIVARMNDSEKRISSALKAWRRIERSGATNWSLIIIGDGPDRKKLERTARRFQLENVSFLGHQDPSPYYRVASLLFMTSRIEGWGLTVTEALQFGVVPIAFRSYASIEDILAHGENGILVPNESINEFAFQALSLMRNRKGRERMARNGIESTQKFDIEYMLDRWIFLFEHS